MAHQSSNLSVSKDEEGNVLLPSDIPDPDAFIAAILKNYPVDLPEHWHEALFTLINENHLKTMDSIVIILDALTWREGKALRLKLRHDLMPKKSELKPA